jgi:acetyltransferase-like isoleucine patch superfamily enzyme
MVVKKEVIAKNGSLGMKSKIRIVTLAFLAVMPTSLKKVLYRWLFGYQIGQRVHIGVAYLDCRQLTIRDDSSISHGVAFVHCGSVSIGAHVVIGALNVFRGGEHIEVQDYCQLLRLNAINAIPNHDCTNNPKSSFTLGYGSVITSEHRIDFTDEVCIGRCCTLAGRASSIWTHNRRTGNPVFIGDYCYIGSEVRMAPGARVGNCSIVGLGSVVTRGLWEGNCLLAGAPAKKIRALRDEDYELVFGKTRPDLPDQMHAAPAGIIFSKSLQKADITC